MEQQKNHFAGRSGAMIPRQWQQAPQPFLPRWQGSGAISHTCAYSMIRHESEMRQILSANYVTAISQGISQW